MIRILYIDDDPPTVEPIVKYLQTDYDVVVETNSEKARKRCLTSPFDMIILDWEMIAQENGAEILGKIRKENALIRVIVVTAKLYRVKDIAILVNLGISKFHFKNEPDLLKTLANEIKEVVESRDTIVQGLEEWLAARRHMRSKVVRVAGGKSYTPEQLLSELKRDSQMGKVQRRALASALWTFLLSEERRPRPKRKR
jgi:response regulator RpfG family c-di-GMP phosphodiesterase